MASSTPKLPHNPVDGEQVSDRNGNIYEFNAEQNSWIRLGVLESPPVVTLQNDGLVPPEIYDKIKSVEDLIQQGIAFEKTKIYVGKRPDNPYFYFFHSTDDLVKFRPEQLITGEQRIRLEVDRARLLQKLTRTPCIGPQGLPGSQGDPGKDGEPAANETYHQPKQHSEKQYQTFA